MELEGSGAGGGSVHGADRGLLDGLGEAARLEPRRGRVRGHEREYDDLVVDEHVVDEHDDLVVDDDHHHRTDDDSAEHHDDHDSAGHHDDDHHDAADGLQRPDADADRGLAAGD